MKTFGYGSNLNGHMSTLEMVADTFIPRVNTYLEMYDEVLIGKLDFDQNKIYQYGLLKSFAINEEEDHVQFSFETLHEKSLQLLTENYQDLYLTHEGVFDLLFTMDDHKDQQVEYKVLFLTWVDFHSGEEKTYFIAPNHIVPEPLACVAEFWPLVSEIGRDVDFQKTGCHANEMKEILKRAKSQSEKG
ncbi:hypothetical protein [Thermoactinomyces sp. DSM 45892]|uniref:hypothetical protein n=1 Tax=Thermoactinomyces sp. DSM 45892 TaxID=1882753 RepID=UPI0008965088|nr:hypothetical protein [Thermoactinomyces sp. DSM 45892]SDY29447.1 hypothetical protein SAMN05444416_103201 [Thermoactinomyces sp. DSM 45892]